MRSIHALNSHVAGHYGTQQLELLKHANGLGDHVDTAIVRFWNGLFGRKGSLYSLGYHEAYARGLHAFRELFELIQNALAPELARLGVWAQERTARSLARSLPLSYLNAAMLTKPRGLIEDDEGLVHLQVSPAGLTSIDQTAPLRGKDMDDEEQRWYLQSILFPPPSEERVRQVVYGTDWVSRLQQETKLAAPEALAPLIASSFAAGQSHRELAKTLLPIVDGVKSSARRIARTEGMRVAHTLQMDSSRALDDLIIGYQVNATLDNYTRPLHRHRNGTIYYVHPTGHQPGLDQMPHPPIEADGTVAHNCRCWTSPVLSPPAHLVNDPSKLAVFQAAAARTQPSPLVFSDWFTDAPEKLRRSAVGSSRYSLVRDLARVREPSYEHFVNPATGQLMTKQQLAAESTEARRARVRRVRALLAKRREDLATVLTHGFLPGKRPASATLAT